ncbi:hypothetical protein FCP87_05645 [Salmonella enterica]|nr:hypothetical protein [Salmonella enterica]EEJ9112117.1 hypothetical protein [Salmonella enterica subsp. enterica serovar Newport]EKC5820394.1 patatin-like phospholipase family protein [Salmonella enterica subsp. enterica]EAO6290472.1 hypothetical protein [Salmonella enterica]EBO9635234.1 hypothetical protein [Salmonella enterica]
MKKKSNLECFAIFEGGGAKGIAFAGALSAAEAHNINFSGYGGASSGAIIALLATLGYTGKEIQLKLKKNKVSKLLDPMFSYPIIWVKLMTRIVLSQKKILDHVPTKVLKFLYHYSVRYVVSIICFCNPISVMIYAYLFLVMYSCKGIFPTKRLRNTLVDYASEKIFQDCKDVNKRKYRVSDLTFGELERITNKKLKVIGTDILSGKVVEFSSELTPSVNVFDAVAASGAYPLFFRPTKIQDTLVADGGLSCNMPIFVYSPRQYKKLPILAFDLMPDEEQSLYVGNISFINYLVKLCMSAIDASNNIITDVSGGIVVPVKISSRFGTFDFNLKDEELDEIYGQGKDSAYSFLEKNSFIQNIKELREDHKLATSIFGDLNYLLPFIMLDLEGYIPNTDVILKVYTDFTAGSTHICSFASFASFDNTDESKRIEHEKFSFHDDNPYVSSWQSCSTTTTYLPDSNKVLICHPVLVNNPLDRSLDTQNHTVLALLAIEIYTHYTNIPLLDPNGKNTNSILDVDFTEKSYYILDVYSLIIRNAMLGQQVIFHDSKQNA